VEEEDSFFSFINSVCMFVVFFKYVNCQFQTSQKLGTI